MNLRPITTEKAVMLIESQNVLTFETQRDVTREEAKKEIEGLFNVKVERVRTMIRGNQKHLYVKLKKASPAIDVATKLGII
ncbi:50S ribosomal protein L23 [Candidatus Pacearchaeota archaeon]|nr:50S ribosomal protein L23 [Candidatus Pacearchaeota archaeon]